MSAVRTRTSLFTDLRGSTEQRVGLGDERYDVLRREHDQLLISAVEQREGEIVKSVGDGVMASFACASDAVACAVAMQQAIERLNREDTALTPLALGIGISAGDVVIEDLDVHGTSVVEAARLCAAADGGQVLVSEAVRLLAGSRGGQQYLPIDALELKGLTSPVVTFAVVWQATPCSPIPLPPRLGRGRWGYVGRDLERERLFDAFEAANAGRRVLMFVVGEAGIGKTRLTIELAATAHAQGAIVLAGTCDEDLGGPFQPWVGALAHLVAHLSDEVLAAHVAEHGGEIGRIVSDFRRRCPDARLGLLTDRDTERHRLFEAVAALFAAVEAPLVVVLDDLHWADAASIQLLRHLMRVAPPAPMLIVGTYRDTDLDHAHPLVGALADLRRDRLFDRIDLGGLPEADLGELVSMWLGHSVPATLVHSLHAKTDGNPFFVGELLAHIVESGAIAERNGGWTIDRPLERLGIPEGVREVIGRRMARLSYPSNRALAIASVIGREFDLATVENVGIPIGDEFIDAMGEAVRAGLVIEDPALIGRYSFTHALIRETLYDELGAARRVRLHWRIGESLQHSAPDDVTMIAHHLAEGVLAGDVARAVDAVLTAGALALDVGAFETAIEHFGRATAMLDRVSPDDPDRRYTALAGLGDACVALSDVDGYTNAFFAAAALARTHRWPERLARAALGIGSYVQIVRLAPEAAALFDEALEAIGPDDSVERSLLLSNRAYHRALTPGLAEDRHADVDEAAAIAARLGNRRAAAHALFVHVSALRGSPRGAEMSVLSDELLTRAGDLDDVMLQTHALLLGGTAKIQLGDRDGWSAAAKTMTELGRRPNAAYARISARSWGVLELILDQRFEEAEAAAIEGAQAAASMPVMSLVGRSQTFILALWFSKREVALSVLRSFDGLPGIRITTQVLGALTALEDNPAAARSALDALADGGFSIVELQAAQRPWILDGLAELCARTRLAAHAPALERQLRPYSGQLLVGPSALCVQHAADTALARLVALQGRGDEADQLFVGGIALEERVGARLLASTSRLWHAEHLATLGRADATERARAMADECIAAFERCGYYLTERAYELRQALSDPARSTDFVRARRSRSPAS